MPDIHIIPEGEKHLHKEDINCKCEPAAHVDHPSGIMVWIHKAYLAIKDVFKL